MNYTNIKTRNRKLAVTAVVLTLLWLVAGPVAVSLSPVLHYFHMDGALSNIWLGLYYMAPIGMVLGAIVIFDGNLADGAWCCAALLFGFVGSIYCIFATVQVLRGEKLFNEEGRTIECANRERHIGTGILMYAEDYDGRLPPFSRESTTLDLYQTVTEDLVAISNCPDWDGHGDGYGFNSVLNGVDLHRLDESGATVAAFDSLGPAQYTGGGPQQVDLRHKGHTAANILFLDGHVKLVHAGEVNGLKWSLAAAGPDHGLPIQPGEKGWPRWSGSPVPLAPAVGLVQPGKSASLSRSAAPAGVSTHPGKKGPKLGVPRE